MKLSGPKMLCLNIRQKLIETQGEFDFKNKTLIGDFNMSFSEIDRPKSK